jgi:hypothetical protein
MIYTFNIFHYNNAKLKIYYLLQPYPKSNKFLEFFIYITCHTIPKKFEIIYNAKMQNCIKKIITSLSIIIHLPSHHTLVTSTSIPYMITLHHITHGGILL